MRRIFTIFLIFVSLNGFSQSIERQRGDVHYEFFQFKEAIMDYQAALKANNPKQEAYLLERLAQSYKFSFQYAKAEEYFTKLIRLSDKNLSPDIYLDYAAILKINGDYARSRDQYNFYLTMAPNDAFANMQLKSLSWAIRNKDSIRNFTVTPTNLNTNGQSLGYCFFENGIIYSALRLKGEQKDQTLMFDLDFVEMKDSITFFEGEKYMDGINFELNESSPSVSEDGMLVYFSANATKIKNGVIRKKVGDIEISSDGVSNLKIYVAKFENGKFSNPMELPFNNKEYNCTHPCITDNGNTLYFASDMPKGFGGMDIYKVTRKEDGKWGTPENLGPTINTTENEIYPFAMNNVLFFASKGFNGFGGYDLYQSKIHLGVPTAPINMGIPFNSPKDDVAFICRKDGRTGYISSNRGSDEGDDKVYYFIDNKILKETKSPIVDSVKLQPAVIASSEIKPVEKTAPIEAKKNLTPKPSNTKPTTAKVAHAIDTKTEIAKIRSTPVETSKPVKEKSIKTPATSNDDELLKLVFEEVHFKFNDVSIPTSTYPILDSAIHATKLSKTVKVDVSAHTDCRGSSEYNQKLSDRRAAVVKQYLVKKGVASSRIITHGFGETQLLNQCSDGVECTEEQHQVNRRVDIKIVK